MDGHRFGLQLGSSCFPKGNASVLLSVSWTIYSTNTTCYYLYFSSYPLFLFKLSPFVCDQYNRKISREKDESKQASWVLFYTYFLSPGNSSILVLQILWFMFSQPEYFPSWQGIISMKLCFVSVWWTSYFSWFCIPHTTLSIKMIATYVGQ